MTIIKVEWLERGEDRGEQKLEIKTQFSGNFSSSVADTGSRENIKGEIS